MRVSPVLLETIERYHSLPRNCRIYPIRTTARQWKIPIYSKHKCGDICKITYIITCNAQGEHYVNIVNNPDYNNHGCSYSNLINQSIIKLTDFDENDPQTIDGEMLYGRQIVVPDREIFLYINFPVKYPKKIKIKSKDSYGFTLCHLLQTIRSVYEWIYQHEEDTATKKTFIIEKYCECNDVIIKYTETDETDTNCSICYETLDTNVIETSCEHRFHKNCIDEWLSQQQTCPLCRECLTVCDACNNTKITHIIYEGKIIPSELRNGLQRNLTNGVFGIYDYDIDHLLIEDLIYYRFCKTLFINILDHK
jgi:hypothetical protein